MSRLNAQLAILVPTLAGGGMVAAADLSKSYMPLFIAWLLFASIPWLLSRAER